MCSKKRNRLLSLQETFFLHPVPKLSGFVQERISKKPTLSLKTGKKYTKIQKPTYIWCFWIFCTFRTKSSAVFFFPKSRGKKKTVKSLILEEGRRLYVITGKKKTIPLWALEAPWAQIPWSWAHIEEKKNLFFFL